MDAKQKTGIAGLVFALAALVTAVGGLLKPRDDSMTRASYDVLAAKLRTVGETAERNHEDLVWLRAHVVGDKPVEVEATEPDAGAPVATAPDAAPVDDDPEHEHAIAADKPDPPPLPTFAGGSKSTRKAPQADELPTFEQLKAEAAE